MEDRLEQIKELYPESTVREYITIGNNDFEWLLAEVEKLRAWHKSSLETITALTDALTAAKNQETK
jgi:hypothetical protein